jgi:cytidylate kinase
MRDRPSDAIQEDAVAIITISRGTKSGGLKLAERLSERLGYSCISREVIMEGARKYNIMEEDLLQRIDESPGLWQKFTRQHQRYLVYIQCALIDAVKQDNIIYHGYGGQMFLRGIKHVLKIRLDAALEDRIRIGMQEFALSYDEARDYIARVDEERTRWVRSVYGEQWHDPALYDMCFCTRNLTIDSICEIIALAVDRDEFKTTKNSARKLNDLSLECEVRAAFAADDVIWSHPVSVVADDGVVTLRGTVKTAKLRDQIAELVSQVKGVRGCNVEVGLSTDPLPKGSYGHD